MSEKKGEKAVRAEIRKLLSDHADLVISELLERPIWPQGISSQEEYKRFGDDDRFGNISVSFTDDSDGWMYVWSETGEHLSFYHRFRCSIGGGQSLRVRAALLILAKAIQLDNEKRPQDRGPRPR